MHRKKIVFLYFELAGYFLACVEQLMEMYDVEIHIVKYPVNAIAPFQFRLNPAIHIYESKDYPGDALTDLVKKINPSLLYICGWSNKDYIKAGKAFHKSIPVVLTFDNPWRGTLKQYLATLIAGLYLKRIFTHCWVPGEPNARYARKLGFNNSHLLQGMYSADYNLFHSYNEKFKAAKQQQFPRRFIFTGRYTTLKGVRELWSAFIRLQKEIPNEWELWCLGKGELENEFPAHEKIKNIGFIQPQDLHTYLEQTGVFILPAHYEHWGVVVHEFAVAGFPLICTDTTSASTAFLKDGFNGYSIKAKSEEAIYEALKKIIVKTDQELNLMAERSAGMGAVITPATWSDTLMSLIK